MAESKQFDFFKIDREYLDAINAYWLYWADRPNSYNDAKILYKNFSKLYKLRMNEYINSNKLTRIFNTDYLITKYKTIIDTHNIIDSKIIIFTPSSDFILDAIIFILTCICLCYDKIIPENHNVYL